MFADLFPSGRGRPSIPADLIATAMVLQALEGLSDREATRAVREMPEAAAVTLRAHDYDAGPKPVIAWDDPVAKQALITALVADALALIGALEPLSLSGAAADAVGLLALVAGQDVEPGDEAGTWRIARRVAADRTISTVDPEARHTRKSPSQPRDGYKANVAVEPQAGLITDAVLTPANVSDAEVAPELLEHEEASVEVLGDSAYGSGRLRAGLDAAGHTATIKPIPSRPLIPGGFARDDFAVDHETNTVTCPAGVIVTFGRRLTATFGSRCTGCPLRARCTTSPNGSERYPEPLRHRARGARRRAETEEFQSIYRRWRPMVERTIAWVVAGRNRRLRYRGVARNHQWLLTRTAALNLRRLVNLGLGHNGVWAVAT